MYVDARKFFGIEKSFTQAGYYKTGEYNKLYENLKLQICSGGIFTLTGMVGSGKTTLLHHMQHELESENKIKISRLSPKPWQKLLFHSLSQADKKATCQAEK